MGRRFMLRLSFISVALTTACLSAAGSSASTADEDREGEGNVVIAPPYVAAPEMTANPNVPQGTVTTFTMNSLDSKVFPGLNGPFMRNVAVYVPKQYVSGTVAPFIVAQDGRTWTPRLVPLLDNMIADRRLPPMVAIMIDNGGGDSKGSERGLEYDTMSGRYAEFVETEVLPRVEHEAHVRLSRNPDARATLGGSSGAAAAFTMAWYHPELYHRVLSYSGTFVNQQHPVNPATPHGAWEYHERLIRSTKRKPIRLWMEVGERDNGYKTVRADQHNWVMANDSMAKVLSEKGYHYRYVFAKDAGHVDRRVVFQTLPDAMRWLWRGYRPE